MIIEAAPNWIQALSLLFRRFPDSNDSEHFSAVIAPPSASYFSATAALAALDIDPEDSSKQIESGTRVATIVGNEFRDVTFHQNPFRLDGSTFAEGKTPPIYELPDSFPTRKRRSLSADSAKLMIELDGSIDALKPNWALLKSSAHPVLVLCTRPTVIAEKLAEQLLDFEIWDPIQRVGASEPGLTIGDWFRSPIVLANPSGLNNKPWLSELRPRVVINVGMAAWLRRFRWIWPEIPHVLLLDPTSEDVYRFRDWFADREIEVQPQTLSGFEGVPGLPMKIFAESPGVHVDGNFDDDQEDDYA